MEFLLGKSLTETGSANVAKWGALYTKQLAQKDSPNAFRAACLLAVAERLTAELGLEPRLFALSRLSELAQAVSLQSDLRSQLCTWATSFESEPSLLAGASQTSGNVHLRAAHRLGETLDLLLALEKTGERRKIGSYYTPVSVARSLVARAIEGQSRFLEGFPSICDPACGGGAFLLEAAAQLAERRCELSTPEGRGKIADHVYGVDSSSLAVAVAELALWIFVGDASRALPNVRNFKCADALIGQSFQGQTISLKSLEAVPAFHFPREFSAVFSRSNPGFDWIVGNPPWVAFQGRATQKISAERRAYYRKYYQAFRGYPTLHGLFIERAVQLAPRGVLTLLIPSSVSDLEGYRFTRQVVEKSHCLAEPLLEFGQDAFDGVVQPCFGLIAHARENESTEVAHRTWILDERGRIQSAPTAAQVPEVLSRFHEASMLAPATFKEMGFQSNRVVAAELFLRAERGDEKYTVPLLEGRNVAEFCERPARLFLAPDAEILAGTRCRLRPAEDYQRVDFVVRQTAAFTIAAAHHGDRFRNSLIAGFATEETSAPLLLALLNSSLYRALHVSRQRDARQVTFPQVKLSHLRRLPRPPVSHRLRPTLEQIADDAQKQGGLQIEQRQVLDNLVFEMFGLTSEQGSQVIEYLRHLVPAALRGSTS